MTMRMDQSGKGGKMGQITAKPKDTFTSIKRLLNYMKKSSILIVFSLAAALVGTVMQVMNPKILGSATTVIFTGIRSAEGIDFTLLSGILITAGVLYLGVFICSFLQEWLMTIVSQKTTQVLRNELRAKMNRVPVNYFDKNANGDLMSIAANDVDNIATNLQQSLNMLISSIVLVIGTLGIMLYISPMLTLITAVVLPASVLIGKIFTPYAQKHNKKYVKSMGEMNGRIEETYEGFSVIKSFNGEKEAVEKFEKANSQMCDSGWKAKFAGGTMMHCMMLVQNGIYVVIAAAGAMRVIGGTILIGDMQAFLQYSQQFSSPISRLAQVWGSLLSALASAERVFDILDAEEMAEYEEAFENKANDTGKIVFEDVVFGYTEQPLMQGFDLAVAEGQMVAIVGHTGAGKTTLVNLLERFYEIKDGAIRIDGKDIRNMNYSELRGKTSMVLQDTWLFAGTIYDNIKYGNEDASEEDVYRAAKAAYAHEFISKLPQGYDTVLGEEASNISQGQKQLITIARAFIKNPDILILDEATSNVDSRTEMIIQKAMRNLLKGRTSFVIAHRLSTIYDADKIIVMEDGCIKETGNHKELIKSGGTYADIYNSQFAQDAA